MFSISMLIKNKLNLWYSLCNNNLRYLMSFFCIFFILNWTYSHNKEETHRIIDSLLDLAQQADREVNPEACLKFALEAKQLSESVDFSLGKAQAYFFVGQALMNMGSYDYALEYLIKSEQEKYSQSTPILVSEINRVKGRVYNLINFTDKAIEEYHKGLKSIQKVSDSILRKRYTIYMHENLAYAYKSKKMWDSTFYHILQAQAILYRLDEKYVYNQKVNLFGLKGDYYGVLKAYDSAIHYFNKSLEIAEKYNFNYTSTVYKYWGDLELGRDNLQDALYYYTQAKKNAEITNMNSELPKIYEALSQVYQTTNQDSAKYYNLKAITSKNEIDGNLVLASKKALDLIMQDGEQLKFKQIQKIRYVFGSVIVVLILVLVLFYFRMRILQKGLGLNKNKESREIKDISSAQALMDLTKIKNAKDPHFLNKVQEAYPAFYTTLFKRHPDLTRSETILCVLIYMNFSTKDISEFMFIEPRSVQTKKNRLRKKLNLPPNENIFLYFQEMESF